MRERSKTIRKWIQFFPPGACEGNCKKMAGGDGQSNGKRSRALNAVLVVLVGSGGKDNKHQHHGDEELHTKGLARSESFVDCGCAKPIPSAHRGRHNSHKNSAS